VQFSLLNLTSGGNNFNDFSEKQLPKFQQIGMAQPYQISDWYGGRHDTASGATDAGRKEKVRTGSNGERE